MVVASVPLWVCHPASSDSAGGPAGLTPSQPKAAAEAAAAAAGGADQSSTTPSNTAASLLSLLTGAASSGSSSTIAAAASTSGGGGSAARTPIYSTDVHPDGTRFVTAGGDGTVRIWSLGCVFGKVEDDDGGDGSKGVDPGKGKQVAGEEDGKSTKKGKRRVASFTKGGGYVSSESEGSDRGGDSGGSIGSGGNDSGGLESDGDNGGGGGALDRPPVANDLTGLVRRKKDATAAAPSSSPAAPPPAPPQSQTQPAVQAAQPNEKDTTPASAAPAIGGGKKRKRAVLTTMPFAGGDGANDNASPRTAQDGNDDGEENDGDGDRAASAPNNSRQPIPKKDRLLCTLTSHSGSVLSVRFSTSGKYLASAGDDTLVLIYSRTKSRTAATGNLVGLGGQQKKKDVEHWSRIRICRGHGLDVVGLAWAPDDSHLVSCSLDSESPVCVWKLNLDGSNHQGGSGGGHGSPDKHHHYHHHHHGQAAASSAVASPILTPHKILARQSDFHHHAPANDDNGPTPHHNGHVGITHTSTVKGVAFDPTGKYLATSGDDPAVCIWSTGTWTLEARVGRDCGIFGTNKSGGAEGSEALDGTEQLSTQSLFRRISFSPDGTHVCSTNSTVRGKNVAAMISREGWLTAASSSDRRNGPSSGDGSSGGGGAGAANLVGHRSTVVASRHCPYFLDGRNNRRKRARGSEKAAATSRSSDGSTDDQDDSPGVSSSEDDDGQSEPPYATLLALGDKRGFVTVWSTKKSRPLFKVQVSESRCTVTDLSWGLVGRSRRGAARGGGGETIEERDRLVLLVSLLDGNVTAFRFDVPREVGPMLPIEDRNKIFRLRYGIELGVGDDLYSAGGLGGGGTKLLIDDSSKPRLIENALQLTLEEEEEDRGGSSSSSSSSSSSEDEGGETGKSMSSPKKQRPVDVRAAQVTTTNKSGKKRITPVLMSVSAGGASGTDDEHDDEDDDDGVGGEGGTASGVYDSDSVPLSTLARTKLLEGRMSGDDENDDDAAADGDRSRKKKKKKRKKDKKDAKTKGTTGSGGGGDVSAMKDALSTAAEAAEKAEGLAPRTQQQQQSQQRADGEVSDRHDSGGEEKKDDVGGGSEVPSRAPAAAAADQHHRHGGHEAPPQAQQQQQRLTQQQFGGNDVGLLLSATVVPPSTGRIYSVDLLPMKPSSAAAGPTTLPSDLGGSATKDTSDGKGDVLVADCSNVSRPNPLHRSTSLTPCVNFTISSAGQIKYRDTISSATCTALAATPSLLVVGTYDGTVYIYGTSPTLGWKSGIAFRCYGPLVLGGSVVRLHLRESDEDSENDKSVEMLAVTSDGAFGLYRLVPKAELLYGGTVAPAMNHMRLSAAEHGRIGSGGTAVAGVPFPQLARVQITDSGRLLLILSYGTTFGGSGTAAGGGGLTTNRHRHYGHGGSGSAGGLMNAAATAAGNVQGFVYDRPTKLWVRITDGRFVLSDFYGAATHHTPPSGQLARIDEISRSASGAGGAGGLSTASGVYRHGTNGRDGDSTVYTATRGNCEDRMACALALGSPDEFGKWLGLYARHLAVEGNASHLRLLVDLLLGDEGADGGGGGHVAAATVEDPIGGTATAAKGGAGCVFAWWLSSAPAVLGMDRKNAIRRIIMPEMSKNRALQRLTNEIATDLDALSG